MCCRYFLLKTHARDLLAKAGVPDEEGDVAYSNDNYNIAPASKIRVVRKRQGRAQDGRESESACAFECVAMHWGMQGGGAGASLLGNARAESLWERATFREAAQLRRCLIPASGFYEWERVGGAREARFPWLFQLRGGDPFFLAGIWNRDACVVVTTEPNEVMRPVHHRMPMIVQVADAERWMSGGMRESVAGLMVPLRDELLVARRVSRFVNSVRNNGVECLKEAAGDDLPEGRQGLLF